MRIKGFIPVVLLTFGSLVVVAPAHALPGCTIASQWGGDCDQANPDVSGEVSDGSVELIGSQNGGGGAGSSNTPGSEGEANPGTPGGATGGGAGPGAPTIIPPPVGDNGYGDADVQCRFSSGGFCIGDYIPDLPLTEPPAADGDSASSADPVVTISDIASFRPQPAVQYMQPDGWMVVGLPTNFYARIDPHVVAGTLLGAPAEVRFTPRAYRWTYGDGTSAMHGTPGDTWSALGLAEFDPTPTSHVYEAEGTYVITLDVVYTAEYRWASGGWIALDGAIELPANELVAQAASEAVTVLVDRDCTQSPAGPGC